MTPVGITQYYLIIPERSREPSSLNSMEAGPINSTSILTRDNHKEFLKNLFQIINMNLDSDQFGIDSYVGRITADQDSNNVYNVTLKARNPEHLKNLRTTLKENFL